MGECGCCYNDERYTFPAPNKAFYLLTLSGPCTNCVAPAGISIELIERGNIMYADYKRGDFNTKQLQFEDWPDNKGVGIVTGLIREDFIKRLTPHLVGVNSNEIGDENGLIDEVGADVILEEMYDDAQMGPKLAIDKQ